MKKFILYTFIVFIIIGLGLYTTARIVLSDKEFGKKMDAESLEKANSSVQFNGKIFKNNPDDIPFNYGNIFKEWKQDQVRVPPKPFPIEKPEIAENVSDSLNVTWFGHATVYIEMDGKRILTDPMLSDYAFPLKVFAPKRFNPSPLTVEQLPAIDIVTISHDHFDHLDMRTVRVLAKKGAQFFVGIGIKAHLNRWGIADDQIHEMDWWESIAVDDFKIHCTPSRHYSGRTGFNNLTLWTSWVIESPKHKIFHSGDSGYAEHFKEIGDKFGFIDIGFIKIGDYGEDPGWRDIHMHTKNSVQAAKDINANSMLPIHWGTFELSYHDWDEPIELSVKYSNELNQTLVTPKLGQTIKLKSKVSNEHWWRALKK